MGPAPRRCSISIWAPYGGFLQRVCAADCLLRLWQPPISDDVGSDARSRKTAPSSSPRALDRSVPADATAYGLSGSQGYWWSNHTWFFWRQDRTLYAASLHYFGIGTKRLLGRLIEELRPANELMPYEP
jgi:hypothetical protein